MLFKTFVSEASDFYTHIHTHIQRIWLGWMEIFSSNSKSLASGVMSQVCMHYAEFSAKCNRPLEIESVDFNPMLI